MPEYPTEFCPACGRGILGDAWFCGFCGTFHLASPHRVLRYDGIYLEKARGEPGRTWRTYFRFYPDKFVTAVPFSHRAESPIATWWGKRCQNLPGVYRINKRDIEIAIAGRTKMLFYMGRISTTALTIESVNGEARREFYRFVYGPEGKREPASPLLPVTRGLSPL